MSAMNGRQGRIASKGTERSQQRRDKTRRDETAAARSSSASQKRLRRRTGEWRARDGREAWKGHGPGSQAGSLDKQPMSGAQIGLRIPIWHSSKIAAMIDGFHHLSASHLARPVSPGTASACGSFFKVDRSSEGSHRIRTCS